MEKRMLGKGLEVSAVGLGCMGMTHAYGAPADQGDMLKLMAQAVELGVTFFDTAECYTGENPDGSTAFNEELVGEGLAPYRDKIVLATKCGIRFTPNGAALDSRRGTIRASLEGSLKRLRTDYVDLYYQHRIDPQVEPEEVAETMKELIQEGKIRYWGISEINEEYLRRANAVCPVAAIQNRYSMMARQYESLFPVCEELDVGYVAFSPLANGFLTAAYSKDDKFAARIDYRSHMPQFTEQGMEQNRPFLDLVKKYAAEKNATPAQISLAWMLCKNKNLVPIPGTRKPDRLVENCGSAYVKLTASEVEELDQALDDLHRSNNAAQRG